MNAFTVCAESEGKRKRKRDTSFLRPPSLEKEKEKAWEGPRRVVTGFPPQETSPGSAGKGEKRIPLEKKERGNWSAVPSDLCHIREGEGVQTATLDVRERRGGVLFHATVREYVVLPERGKSIPG